MLASTGTLNALAVLLLLIASVAPDDKASASLARKLLFKKNKKSICYFSYQQVEACASLLCKATNLAVG